MTLLKLCDPLFKYVCFLNRSSRKGATVDSTRAEAEVETILSEIRSKANAAAGVGDLFDKVRLPLVFFVDNVICSGPSPLSDNWQRLAYKEDRVAGDTDFCDELDALLDEPETPSSNERLAVFYTCVGLGFTGDRLSDPALRQKRMSQVARRLRGFMELEDRARVTPQAYGHTLKDNLVPPPVAPAWRMGVALVGLIVMLAVLNGYLFHEQSNKLDSTLKQMADQPQAKSQTKESRS